MTDVEETELCVSFQYGSRILDRVVFVYDVVFLAKYNQDLVMSQARHLLFMFTLREYASEAFPSLELCLLTNGRVSNAGNKGRDKSRVVLQLPVHGSSRRQGRVFSGKHLQGRASELPRERLFNTDLRLCRVLVLWRDEGTSLQATPNEGSDNILRNIAFRLQHS